MAFVFLWCFFHPYYEFNEKDDGQKMWENGKYEVYLYSFHFALYYSYFMDGRVNKVEDFLKTRLLDTMAEQLSKVTRVCTFFLILFRIESNAALLCSSNSNKVPRRCVWNALSLSPYFYDSLPLLYVPWYWNMKGSDWNIHKKTGVEDFKNAVHHLLPQIALV